MFNAVTMSVVCMMHALCEQEWEAFTGLIVTDTKHESGKDIPNWIEPDRTPAVLLLKVTACRHLVSRLQNDMFLNNNSALLKDMSHCSLWNVCMLLCLSLHLC